MPGWTGASVVRSASGEAPVGAGIGQRPGRSLAIPGIGLNQRRRLSGVAGSGQLRTWFPMTATSTPKKRRQAVELLAGMIIDDDLAAFRSLGADRHGGPEVTMQRLLEDRGDGGAWHPGPWPGPCGPWGGWGWARPVLTRASVWRTERCSAIDPAAGDDRVSVSSQAEQGAGVALGDLVGRGPHPGSRRGARAGGSGWRRSSDRGRAGRPALPACRRTATGSRGRRRPSRSR